MAVIDEEVAEQEAGRLVFKTLCLQRLHRVQGMQPASLSRRAERRRPCAAEPVRAREHDVAGHKGGHQRGHAACGAHCVGAALEAQVA